MEALSYLEVGFGSIFTLQGMLYVVVGLLVGVVFAAIPGLSGLMAIILMIPFSYNMSAIDALVLFSAIYVGSNFGGSISAILVNIPGSPEAICTTYDGYAMTQKGQAGKALATAMTCSSIGGILSVVLMVLFSPLLAKFALKFTPAEFFSLVMMGLFVVTSVSGDDLTKGLIPLFFGILVGTVGMGARTGMPRFDFDISALQSGFQFISIMLGMFVVGEIFIRFEKLAADDQVSLGKVSSAKLSLRELWRLKGTIIKSFFIGSGAGLMPGLGVILAIFTSYSMARQSSPHPEKFGTGVFEGVAAPETANNASAGGAMIPLLTMGIPGSAVTAVLMGVLVMHDIQPGPFVFLNSKDLVGAIFIAMFLANLLIIITGRIAARGFSQFLKIHYAYLMVVVLIFSFLGCYSLRSFMFDAWIMLLFGVVGYLMRKFDYPIGPLVLGLVLGPIAEDNFLGAMELYDDNLMIFLTRPVSLLFLVAGGLIFFYPIIKKRLRARRDGREPGVEQSTPNQSPTSGPGEGVLYLLFLIGLIYLFSLTGSYATEDLVYGAEAWPRISIGALIILSIIKVVTAARDRRRARVDGVRIDGRSGQGVLAGGPINPVRFFICLGLIAAYLAGIAGMGFIAANLILLPMVMLLSSYRRKVPLVLFPIIMTGATSVLFYRYLYISLPKGGAFFQDLSVYLFSLIR